MMRLIPLVTLISIVSVVNATPCTFVTQGQQITYGIRGDTVHFRVVLTGISPSVTGWTAIGFGNSMVKIQQFVSFLHY
ncbi:unnamed protein product [Caenorhabditis bovis]|uniref:DOMON domain-containing protein n=1 Tax=Caenorhabditis bovis TaxID=2654633 RepID=A0A8S1EI89_9PELO|nr:unnamed protein product [Caenorhabditis bovis]